jgi:hypothetical protein
MARRPSTTQITKENKEKAMKKTTSLSIAGLLAIGLIGVNLAQAQSIGGQNAGTLDPTFGNGGTLATSLGVSVNPVAAIEQSNGNIVVVAGINNDQTGVFDFGMLVYTSNGTLIGHNQVAFGSNPNNIPIAAVAQPNGDIIVAGTSAPAGIEAEELPWPGSLPTDGWIRHLGRVV